MKLIVPDCLCLANTAIGRQVITRSIPLEKKAALWLLVIIKEFMPKLTNIPHTYLIVRAALNDGIRDLQLNITPVILEG